MPDFNHLLKLMIFSKLEAPQTFLITFRRLLEVQTEQIVDVCLRPTVLKFLFLGRLLCSYSLKDLLLTILSMEEVSV